MQGKIDGNNPETLKRSLIMPELKLTPQLIEDCETVLACVLAKDDLTVRKENSGRYPHWDEMKLEASAWGAAAQTLIKSGLASLQKSNPSIAKNDMFIVDPITIAQNSNGYPFLSDRIVELATQRIEQQSPAAELAQLEGVSLTAIKTGVEISRDQRIPV